MGASIREQVGVHRLKQRLEREAKQAEAGEKGGRFARDLGDDR